MNYNKKLFSFLPLPILILGIFIFSAQPANAGILLEATSSFFVLGAQVIGYIFGAVAGVLMTVAGFLIGFALNLNAEIMESLTVVTGWKIILNIANLGFVLGIIIIAFSTIFRFQGYQMKQILWKLVVAALLVNFSLVIAGVFIDTADAFTNFFMEQGGITNFTEWVDAFAGMFRAQALLKVSETFSTQGSGGAITGAVNTLGAFAITNIASIFFVVIFTVLAAITMLSVAIMLLVRYVYLGILLILSPIVWLLWIFPGTKSYWSKWWDNFIRWTFFAPIMMFFMYLALYTMKNQSGNIDDIVKNSGGGNINLTFGAEVIGEMAIVIGLVMGGLIAANSIGIMGAKAGMGMAKSFGGWVGKKAGQAGLTAAGKATGNEKIKALADKWKEGGAFKKMAARGLNYVGLKTEKATQKSYDDEIKDYKGPRLETEILVSSGLKQAALINKAVKDKDISEKVRKQVLSDPAKMEKIENDLKRAGYKPDGFAKLIGYNAKILRAVIKGNADELEKATKEFYDKFDQKDWSNITPSSLVDPKLGDVVTENLLMRSTGSISKILPKAKKKEDINKIIEKVQEVYTKLEDDSTKPGTTFSNKEREQIGKIGESLKKHLASRITGGGEEEKEEKKEEEKKEKK
jgi:soluble cytochrome b562